MLRVVHCLRLAVGHRHRAGRDGILHGLPVGVVVDSRRTNHVDRLRAHAGTHGL